MENASKRPPSFPGAVNPSTSNAEATHGSGGHRRTLSGSILAKLPFLLRPSAENLFAPTTTLPINQGVDEPISPPDDHVGSGTKNEAVGAGALKQQRTQTRKRKGSLRKTALLGTGKMRRSLDTQFPGVTGGHDFATSPESPEDTHQQLLTGREFATYDGMAGSVPSPSESWTAESTDAGGTQPSSSAASPINSPTGNPYASTTDDDDTLSFSRPTTNGSSYFPLHLSSSSTLQRRRSNKAQQQTSSSTMATTHHHGGPPTVLISSDDDWDYSETEWWGWTVLVVTWIVFVVGMGSCLGVWSWAWDVGETPYAPPELEDDATLPIVGYYPALIIMTAVMAWVWVVVAWAGMKSFRHAKVVGEEG